MIRFALDPQRRHAGAIKRFGPTGFIPICLVPPPLVAHLIIFAHSQEETAIMKTLPEGLVPYRRTPVFTETTLPAGLRKDHSIKSGVWGVIHVTAGRLRYTIPSRDEAVDLHPGLDGIVEPEVLHFVTPLGAVNLYIEFWRQKLSSVRTMPTP